MDRFEQSNVKSVWPAAVTCEICLEYSGLDLSTSAIHTVYYSVQCNFKNLKKFERINSGADHSFVFAKLHSSYFKSKSAVSV